MLKNAHTSAVLIGQGIWLARASSFGCQLRKNIETHESVPPPQKKKSSILVLTIQFDIVLLIIVIVWISCLFILILLVFLQKWFLAFE